MNAPEPQSLNKLAATKICRKAPLPRFALKPSLLEQAEQLWEDTVQALLLSGVSAVHNPRTQKDTGAAPLGACLTANNVPLFTFDLPAIIFCVLDT